MVSNKQNNEGKFRSTIKTKISGEPLVIYTPNDAKFWSKKKGLIQQIQVFKNGEWITFCEREIRK